MLPNSKKKCFGTLTFAATFLTASLLIAYPVGIAFNLEQLNAQADIIVKVIALESKPLEGDWFKKHQGCESLTTKLKVVSVVKGKVEREVIDFQHYTLSNNDFMGMHVVQSYEFKVGQPYILLAKKTDKKHVYRQCWRNHTTKGDQGILLAASDQPIRTDSIKETYWNELTGFLSIEYENEKSREESLNYAIRQLASMSTDKDFGVGHFDRATVLAKIVPFISDRSDAVARQALEILASRNPYATRFDNPFWLASRGQGHIPGFADTYENYVNLGGVLFWKELVDLAGSTSDAEFRTMAIRALGTAARPEVRSRIDSWLKDENVEVRAAATALLGDYPSKASSDLLHAAIGDGEELIRQAAAHAIGNGQNATEIELLEQLLDDDQPMVTASAAMSLLSFSIGDTKEFLQRNLSNKDFGHLFAIALAKHAGDGAEPYLDHLCQAAQVSLFEHIGNSGWWGGQHPSGQAWELLLEYANSKTAQEIEDAEFLPVIESLVYSISTNPWKGFDNKTSESGDDWKSNVGSHVPEGIYKLYVSKGLTERAKEFRTLCKKRLSFNAEIYFERIDKATK